MSFASRLVLSSPWGAPKEEEEPKAKKGKPASAAKKKPKGAKVGVAKKAPTTKAKTSKAALNSKTPKVKTPKAKAVATSAKATKKGSQSSPDKASPDVAVATAAKPAPPAPAAADTSHVMSAEAATRTPPYANPTEAEIAALVSHSKAIRQTNKRAGKGKRLPGPYMNFCMTMRPKIVTEDPILTFGDVGKKLCLISRGMSDDEKAKYSLDLPLFRQLFRPRRAMLTLASWQPCETQLDFRIGRRSSPAQGCGSRA